MEGLHLLDETISYLNGNDCIAMDFATAIAMDEAVEFDSILESYDIINEATIKDSIKKLINTCINAIKKCINTLLSLFKKRMIMGDLNILAAAQVEVYARSKHIDKNLIKSKEIYKYLKPDTEIRILKMKKGEGNRDAVLDEAIASYNRSKEAFLNYFRTVYRKNIAIFKNEVDNDPDYLKTVDIYKAGFNIEDDDEKLNRYADAANKLFNINTKYINDFKNTSIYFDKNYKFTTEKVKAGEVDVIKNIDYDKAIINMGKDLIDISYTTNNHYKALLKASNAEGLDSSKAIVSYVKKVMKTYNALYLFYIDLFKAAYKSSYNITLAAMKDYVATRDNKDTNE
jgi:hypothetical protein